MGDPGRRVELRVDPVAAPSLNDDKAPRRGVFLDDLAELANGDPWFDDLNSHVQGLARRFHEPNRVGIRFGLVANIVGLVQVGMVSTVVQRNVEVEDVAIQKNSLIRNAVAYNLIRRRTYGLGKVVVVEW